MEFCLPRLGRDRPRAQRRSCGRPRLNRVASPTETSLMGPPMGMIRFCPRCGTDVEEVDGFCLLGHSLRLRAPRESLRDLRAEVDRAFEEARQKVSAVLGPPVPAPAPAVPPRVPPPPPGPARRTPPRGSAARLTADAATRGGAGSARLPPAAPAAPPPPPPRDDGTRRIEPARGRENEGGSDPIAAFAPPPRMDWGPERHQLLKRYRSI